MTPAVRELKQKKIPFELHTYQHDTNSSSYGLEVLEKLSLNAEQVYKTLVISSDCNQLAVALVPVNKKLNLKAMAKTLNVKKVKMAEAKLVQTSTGYVLGGVSPLGQKKKLITVIDLSAQQFRTIFISGGKRGLEIELSPDDLQALLQATIAKIAT